MHFSPFHRNVQNMVGSEVDDVSRGLENGSGRKSSRRTRKFYGAGNTAVITGYSLLCTQRSLFLSVVPERGLSRLDRTDSCPCVAISSLFLGKSICAVT